MYYYKRNILVIELVSNLITTVKNKSCELNLKIL